MALRMASLPAPAKFGVYESATISSALSRQTSPRKPWHLPVVSVLCGASVWATWSLQSRAEGLIGVLRLVGVCDGIAGALIRILQWATTIFFAMSISALFKVINMPAAPDTSLTLSTRAKKKSLSSAATASKIPNSSPFQRQQAVTPKQWYERTNESPAQTSPLLLPVHPPLSKTSKLPNVQWTARRMLVPPVIISPSTTNTSSSPAPSGSPYPAPPQAATPASQGSTPSNGPGSKERLRSATLDFRKEEIDNERQLVEFLAEVDSKLVDSSVKAGSQATPPPTVQRVGSGPSPSTAVTPTSVSGTPNSAARALRMSPGAPKTGSPKKGEVEMPIPMSMEQATEVLRRLGVNPQIELWRDRLRQWFSDVLLNPLVRKIDTSHLQITAAAAKLGVAINFSQIGGSKQDGGSSSILSDGSQQEWLTTMAPDEDAFLHQLRSALLQARDAPPPQPTAFGLSPPPQRVYNPDIQVCLDAVTEHQRLKALMKGEWVKGLLPQTSVRADHTVRRIRELAEGTCVKAFEFWQNGEVYDKIAKLWTPELPSDAHLLLYLFCALLEHPQWMLHVDPTSYPSTQSSNNSLFIAGLPQKERYPEKYIAIISGAPPVVHCGATILAVGKLSPPVLALYWDKKLQYSFQGRSALWDAILLLCYRVKVAHGGVVRGINLGSPAFNLLSVLETSR